MPVHRLIAQLCQLPYDRLQDVVAEPVCMYDSPVGACLDMNVCAGFPTQCTGQMQAGQNTLSQAAMGP